MSLYLLQTHNLSNVCAFKMHKLLINSVTKLKNLNIRNLVAERSHKNGLSCCGIHTVSNSNVKKQNSKGTYKFIITPIVAVVLFVIFFG